MVSLRRNIPSSDHLTICLATQNLAITNSDQVSIPRPSAERVYLSNLKENAILYVR